MYGQKGGSTPLQSGSLGLKGFTGPVHFLNTHGMHFEDRDTPLHLDHVEHENEPINGYDGQALRQDNFDDEPGTSTQAVQSPEWLIINSFSPTAYDTQDMRIFDYYLHGLCPQLSNSSTENPYLEFLAPLSMDSQPLYHSILSWSAHEMTLRDPLQYRYQELSVKHKVKALGCLRSELELSQNSPNPSASTLTSVLATMIILSCQEIAESCSSGWISHLKAARVLCSLLWPRELQSTDRFRKFCVMWLVSHEMMSRTAWVEDTLFEPSEWFAGDDESEIDVMIGCSRGLVHQVSEIGKLIMQKRLDPRIASSLSFLSQRDRIEHSLEGLGQCISKNAAATPTELLDVAESKRLCALIYLHTCIDGATPATPGVQKNTATVMRLLRRLPPKPSLTFPLFVVGTLGVWNEDDRRLVMDKFTQLIKARPLASITRAFEIVKEVWVDRDLGRYQRWEDLVETRGRLLSLA